MTDSELHTPENGIFSDELSEWSGIGGSTVAEDEEENVPTLLPAPEEAPMPGNNAVFVSDVSLTNHLGSRYVPPHLRNRPDADEKDLELVGKLARQLKGLLNRLVHI